MKMKTLIKQQFRGKTILITGGTGSIGSEIVRQVLKHSPKQVRVFSRDETKQHDLRQELSASGIDDKKVRFLIGDIRDKERISLAVHGADILFHAAAMKHVPACEYNPFEAIKTNVAGAQNVVQACISSSVDKAVMISTDKAVNPVGVMGTTKLLAEKIFLNANYYKGSLKKVFSCVRFGNVMGTRGSVIDLFKSQIIQRRVTITSSKMTRFMMSIPQAVSLVLQASAMMTPSTNAAPGRVFILKMPCMRITDLAEVLVEVIAKKEGFDPKTVKIEMTGKRPGEKEKEELITEQEMNNAIETNDMIIVRDDVELPQGHLLIKKLNAKRLSQKMVSDKNVLTKQQIRELLVKNRLV